MKNLRATIAGMSLLVTACGPLKVGPATPRPNVVVAQANTPSVVLIAPGVPDQFVIPEANGIRSVNVRGWRGTLQAAFHNAFPSGGPNGRKLELVSVELSFAPAAVSAHYGVAAIIAQIRYKVRLLDASGQELGAAAGTVEAREASVSAKEEAMTNNAAKAVEALYEKVTAELLNGATASPPAAPAPGKSI